MRNHAILTKVEPVPAIAAAFRCTACPQTAKYVLQVRRLAETNPSHTWRLCEQHAIQFGNSLAALRANMKGCQ